MLESNSKRGWIVALAGMGINLALGVLYSWGAFQAVLVTEPFNWTATQSQIPYMVACLIFALSMVPGGRLQDRIGPRVVITLAGIAALVSLVLSGYTITPVGLTISFGVLFGLAMGFGYAAPTPAAVKWFGPHQRGLISGIVVSGFGLAGIYVAPLVRYLLEQFNLGHTFVFLGIAYGIVIIALAQLISNPPSGFSPPQYNLGTEKKRAMPKSWFVRDYEWREIVKTPQFFGLWGMFCIGTFAGLLIIGQLRSIGVEQAALSDDMAFWLIALYAIFNWAGRVGCGIVTDKIGARNTLLAMFILQVATFAFFGKFVTAAPLFIGTGVVAFTFGGMLTIFPAITANYFGVKNLGVNYGLVFTAWGGGGVFGPLVGGIVRDYTGTYSMSYTISAVLSTIGIILALTMKPPKETAE